MDRPRQRHNRASISFMQNIIFRWFRLRLATVFLFYGVLCFAGCAPKLQQMEACQPLFGPQKAIQSGEYQEFLEENQKLLLQCTLSNSCETLLFNIGVVHAYSKSPFHDRSKALHYFGQLVNDYPNSPLSYEAMVWIDLIQQVDALEKKRRRLQTQINSKKAAIKTKEKDLRAKDATIDELREQIKRSRDIDLEIGEKEREILY